MGPPSPAIHLSDLSQALTPCCLCTTPLQPHNLTTPPLFLEVISSLWYPLPDRLGMGNTRLSQQMAGAGCLQSTSPEIFLTKGRKSPGEGSGVEKGPPDFTPETRFDLESWNDSSYL